MVSGFSFLCLCRFYNHILRKQFQLQSRLFLPTIRLLIPLVSFTLLPFPQSCVNQNGCYHRVYICVCACRRTSSAAESVFSVFQSLTLLLLISLQTYMPLIYVMVNCQVGSSQTERFCAMRQDRSSFFPFFILCCLLTYCQRS